MRNKLHFSSSALIVIMITMSVIVGCLDATDKNATLEKSYKDNIDKRIVKTNRDFQNPTVKASLLKNEFLESVNDKSRYERTFAVLNADESITENRVKSDLLDVQGDLRLIALTKITEMGTQAYDFLLKSYESADTDAKIEYVIDAFSHMLLNTEVNSSQRENICKILRDTIKSKSDKLKRKAIQLLAKLATETDYKILAENLNVNDEITRLLIYSKLRNTTTYDVLAIIAKHLEASELSVRIYSVNLLRQITKQYFGYNPGGELISRQIQAIRWYTYIQNNNKTNNTISR